MVNVMGSAICGFAMLLECKAQSTASNPDTASSAPASAAPTINREAVMKELDEMKARIAQLEAELKAEKDANALRTAEGTAVKSGLSSPVTPNTQEES
jgi:anaerobic glycerol-3-phosphate dehydrogenase